MKWHHLNQMTVEDDKALQMLARSCTKWVPALSVCYTERPKLCDVQICTRSKGQTHRVKWGYWCLLSRRECARDEAHDVIRCRLEGAQVDYTRWMGVPAFGDAVGV